MTLLGVVIRPSLPIVFTVGLLPGDDYFGSDMTRREPPHHKSSAVEVEEDIYSPDDDHDPPEDPLSGNKPVRRCGPSQAFS